MGYFLKEKKPARFYFKMGQIFPACLVNFLPAPPPAGQTAVLLGRGGWWQTAWSEGFFWGGVGKDNDF